MFLYMINSVGSSEKIKSLPSSEQKHVCGLVISYVKHHRDSLNECYFLALTSELHFPDDQSLAADVATDLLEIMKLTKWVNDAPAAGGIKETCVALISRDLQDMDDPSLCDIATFTERVPESVIPLLLKDSLNGRGIQGDSFDITCIIKTPLFGHPASTTFKISVRSTYSVNYLHYLVGRSLGIMVGGYRLHIYWKGDNLKRGEPSLLSLGFTSDTVLEIDEYRHSAGTR